MRGPDQTLMRDNMLARMEMATPGGPRWPERESIFPHFEVKAPMPAGTKAPRAENPRVEDPLRRFDAAQAYAAGRKAFNAIFRPPLAAHTTLSSDLNKRAGPIRQALDRGERVVLTADGKELAIYEPAPGAVLAACLRRDYAAAGRVTGAMLDAAQTLLPDVDREALRLTIEAALKQKATS